MSALASNSSAESLFVPSGDPITVWINQLKAGQHAAAQQLLEQYFQRAVQLARARLRGRLEADGEDVALSAFKSLCLGAGAGKFPRLDDRDDLWRLLALLTVRKAIDLQRRRKRDTNLDEVGLEQMLSEEPNPEAAAELADECAKLLDRLGDPQLRDIALWKVEGYSNEEIAAKLGCVERSVERKLQRIRILWSGDLPQ
jgi:RNA polymerase sigma factor (sigma-70 family)